MNDNGFVLQDFCTWLVKLHTRREEHFLMDVVERLTVHGQG